MRVIIIRYGELYLKGGNRGFFEGALVSNIKRAIRGISCCFTQQRGRYIISNFSQADELKLVGILKNIFGIKSFSVATRVNKDIKEIIATAIDICPSYGTFKVVTHRADKRFALDTMQVNALVGGEILQVKPNLTVDVHKPDFSVGIDIREENDVYIFLDTILGLDGMPSNTAGSGLLLLSGGIDSPVAGYLMAGRGLKINAIHFHSFPYTSEKARQKVLDLADGLAKYSNEINMRIIKVTKIQETLNKNCLAHYQIVLLRRAMMRLAERTAIQNKDGALITGESLAQVASQTLESIRATDSVVNMPILRPLIGLNKQTIIDYAVKIGTYDISVLPYEDCCTVFLPKHPVTKPEISTCETEEAKFNLAELIEEAYNTSEVVKI